MLLAGIPEVISPFPRAASAAFNTFTTKQNVTTVGQIPVILSSGLRAESKLWVAARGNFSTTGTPTLKLGFWIGTRAAAMTIDLALSSAITTASGAASFPWMMEWEGFCTAAGVTGSLLGQGFLRLGTALTTFAADVPIPITAALRTVAIDTTIERAIGVSAEFSANSASNQVQVDSLDVLILN
jgi:hypothetical protein